MVVAIVVHYHCFEIHHCSIDCVLVGIRTVGDGFENGHGTQAAHHGIFDWGGCLFSGEQCVGHCGEFVDVAKKSGGNGQVGREAVGESVAKFKK